jgi:general secretion pathway protein G
MKRSSMRIAAHGFTLAELVITVAIVGILASAALPALELTVRRNKELELRSALREIRGAIDRYKKAVDDGRIPRRANEPGYPPSLQVLVDGVADAKSPVKQTIYFLRRLPRDPFSQRPGVPAAHTWGLRSYASAPDMPHAGDDVFDVYSTSSGVGLNGVPYRDW